MKKVAVIGLNNFGMEIARELSRDGCSVTAVDKDKWKINKISGDVEKTVFFHTGEMWKSERLDFDQFDAMVLVMTEHMDLNLISLSLLHSLKIGNIIICVENNDQEMIASEYLGNDSWRLVRFDQLLAGNIENILKLPG